MISLYKIDNTSNIHPEQNRDRYTDPNFWPYFKEDMENFKQKLINSNNNNTALLVLRMGHAEHCLFNFLVPYNKKGSIITNGILTRHYTGNQSIETWIKLLESISESDYVTTQIGDDFRNWIWDLIHYKNIYLEFKKNNNLNELFNNPILFSKNYNNNENMDMPLDIIYGLIANKWLLKTFSNQIGFIGNDIKLSIIENLIKYPEYQKYIENDKFLNYIKIPQKCALENDNLENYIYNEIKNSSCKIYFIGAGVSKLKFFHNLKKIKSNGIFIDIGHGLDAIAGLAEHTRPYFGSWQNYKLKNYDYSSVDKCCSEKSFNNTILI